VSAVAFAPVALALLASGAWLAGRGRKVGYFFAVVALLALARAAVLI
jgi:hypothetical protein